MNQPVDFTAEAIKDLSAIASYTAETWGHEQALRYAELLNEKFKKIAKGCYFQVVAGICSCNSCIHYIHVDKQSEPHLVGLTLAIRFKLCGMIEGKPCGAIRLTPIAPYGLAKKN